MLLEIAGEMPADGERDVLAVGPDIPRLTFSSVLGQKLYVFAKIMYVR